LQLTIKTNKMKFKGTKGEWTTGLYPNLNHPHRTVLTTENQKEICTIHLDNIEVRANAKLIAAAPELLKELQKIKLDIEIGVIGVRKSSPIYQGIVRSINKALGL
jgi:K+/H+ antiporter YhaU regulatory subunit KhtT